MSPPAKDPDISAISEGQASGQGQARAVGARGRGRPRVPVVPGKISPLTVRVPGEIKNRLDRAAAESGRTQAQEAALRLEASFAPPDPILPTLERTLALDFLAAFGSGGRSSVVRRL